MTGQILLIEPDVVLGGVLEEVLRHSGYQVIVVQTLRDVNGAVEHIRSVSVVVLDIDTTAAERELAWLVSLEPSSKFLSIVLIGLQAPDASHHRQNVYLSRQQVSQVVWVKKPFRHEELLEAVRRAHESSLLGSALPEG